MAIPAAAFQNKFNRGVGDLRQNRRLDRLQLKAVPVEKALQGPKQQSPGRKPWDIYK